LILCISGEDSDEVMRDSDNLIADPVFAEPAARRPAGSRPGQAHRGKAGTSAVEEDSSDEEVQMQPATSAEMAAALKREHSYLQNVVKGEGSSGVFHTKIGDVEVAVPVPGQRKRRYA
jgi:hypothetical protein